MNKIKAFSLIIAFKRKKRNSKILKKAKYKLACDYGVHPTTFCKLLEQCISEGWVTESGDYYQIKKFSEICCAFQEEIGLKFNFHSILGPNKWSRHQEFSIKKITDELYGKLLLDNVVAPQEYMIRLKSALSSNNHQTVKKSMKQLQKMGLYTCADKIEASIQHSIVSSDRHTANRLKITRYRARKVLNECNDIHREVKSLFYPVKNMILDYDRLRMEFPGAFVMPMPAYGMIKVCFGSVITRSSNKEISSY